MRIHTMRQADASGYALTLHKYLIDQFNVIHICHNCGGSKMTLKNINSYIKTKPDYILFNAGLHDLSINLSSKKKLPAWSSLNEYKRNINKIFNLFLNKKIKKVFILSSAPVQKDWHKVKINGIRRALTRKNNDIIRYNRALKKLAFLNNFTFIDVFSPHHNNGIENYVLPDGEHLNDNGEQKISDIVSTTIMESL